jgi:hypothetical protein
VTRRVSTFTEFCEYILARLYELEAERSMQFIDVNELAAELTIPVPPAWPYEAMETLKRQGFINGIAAMGNPPNVQAMITGEGRVEVERKARDSETVTHAYQQNPTFFINVEGTGHQIAVGNTGEVHQQRHDGDAKSFLDRFGLVIGIIAGLCAIGGTAYGIYSWTAPGGVSSYLTSCGATHTPFPKNARTYVEVVWPHSHASTFRDCDGPTGVGRIIQPNQTVRVYCRVHDVSIPSVKPGGDWYRIASSPWNGDFWSPANTFLNGDPKFGPYHHPTDLRVPKC